MIDNIQNKYTHIFLPFVAYLLVMDIHIVSEFECVYLINGAFSERADTIAFSEYDVVYITAFPIKQTLLPYTVKLCGIEPFDSELASGIRLDEQNYLLTLSPRYSIIYGTTKPLPPPTSIISRLFNLIKSGDTQTAYDMLSHELKGSLSKENLNAFFNRYERLIECKWNGNNHFYLIDKNSKATLHTYSTNGDLVDDIVELG